MFFKKLLCNALLFAFCMEGSLTYCLRTDWHILMPGIFWYYSWYYSAVRYNLADRLLLMQIGSQATESRYELGLEELISLMMLLLSRLQHHRVLCLSCSLLWVQFSSRHHRSHIGFLTNLEYDIRRCIHNRTIQPLCYAVLFPLLALLYIFPQPRVALNSVKYRDEEGRLWVYSPLSHCICSCLCTCTTFSYMSPMHPRFKPVLLLLARRVARASCCELLSHWATLLP